MRRLRGIVRDRSVDLRLLWQGRHEVWQFGEERTTDMTTHERHSYRPAEGSAERIAWDRLTEAEKVLCDQWTAAGADSAEAVQEWALSASISRSSLVLVALGYTEDR